MFSAKIKLAEDFCFIVWMKFFGRRSVIIGGVLVVFFLRKKKTYCVHNLMKETAGDNNYFKRLCSKDNQMYGQI